MTVLVTGGTGFIGSHVAARLVEGGRAVRLLVRDAAKIARVPALTDTASIDVVVGDVTDRESVERALDGCTAVVHAAAHVSLAEREAARAEAVNVGGTRLVVGGAAERKLTTVFVSSVSVFGVGHARVTIDTPLTERGGAYTRSKVAAEQFVREVQERGAAVSTVYPSGVLGPDVPDLGPTFQGLIGWLRTPPKTTSGTSIVDVRDVALAIEHALGAPPERWMLGGTFLTYAELRAAIARVTGVHRRALPTPAPILRFAGRAGDLVKRVVPFDYPLTYESMAMATQACPYDSDATCRALDLQWRPVDETLTDTIRGLAAAGHLNARLAGTRELTSVAFRLVPLPPSGTVTFLFTDIEGSTRLWEERPEEMRAAVAEHDERFRAAIEGSGGYVVKATGDGFHAAFSRAADAVAAAEQCQAALVDLPLLKVRMGINTGEVQERAGDYFGPAVNRAARLMAAGHGGQVLLAAVTAELVPGLTLRSLGEHRLRDLGNPMVIWQLGAGEFPSLQTLDELPGNLPVQVTSFVGRDSEVHTVAARLAEHRLVTLTGVGGVGKTRLAMQVAAEVVPEFPDGAWLCELAPADDAESLVEVLATTFDVATRPGKTRQQSVIEFLAGKHLLVVLDNCEHLLDPAAEFAELVLRHCGSVRVLATSREALAIDGEHVHGLRSIADEDAFRLFVDRARAVRDFDVDDASRTAITEICNRLDDIPLAIELAAARVVSMQPTEIAARLDERFRLLSGGRRRGVERHQTLRATVEWSYSLLEENERLVFDRLGVFPASFTSDAAVGVACGDDLAEWDVIDALTSLARKSMIGTEPGEGGGTRYALLETLRQYGREQLNAQGGMQAARRRHAAYYAQLAERLGRDLITDQEIAARQAALVELDNLRSAVAWSFDAEATDDAQFAIRIVAALGVFANTAKSSGLGAWAERAVGYLDGVELGLRVAVFGASAASALQRGDLDASGRYARLAVADGIPPNCPSAAQAAAAPALAAAATDIPEAIRLLRKGARDLEAIGDTWGVLNLELVAVIMLPLIGDTEAAQLEIATLLPRARQIANPANLVIALFAYACAWWQDNPREALGALEESFALTEQGASDVVLDSGHQLLGQIRHALGDSPGALAALLSAIEVADRDGNRQSVITALWLAVEVVDACGAHDLAAICVGVTAEGPLAPYVFGGPDTDSYAQAREATRGALGEPRYRRLVDEGAAMSYEDAVAWARRAFADQRVDERLPGGTVGERGRSVG